MLSFPQDCLSFPFVRFLCILFSSVWHLRRMLGNLVRRWTLPCAPLMVAGLIMLIPLFRPCPTEFCKEGQSYSSLFIALGSDLFFVTQTANDSNLGEYIECRYVSVWWCGKDVLISNSVDWNLFSLARFCKLFIPCELYSYIHGGS